jgi:integrase
VRGSIRQRGETHTCYWFVVDPGTGKRRQHSKGGFKTKGAAQKYLNVVLPKVDDGSWRPDQALTVKQLLIEHWLPAQKARNLRATTLASYEGTAEWYLIPALGAKKVAALTPADISALVENMRTAKSARGRKGLSARTAQAAVVTLKGATSWALRNGMLSRDPLAGVTPPRRDRRPMKAWDTDEARAFLAYVHGDRLEAAWALFLSRGLRRGELAGLRWDAVNLSEGTLQVTHTRVSVDGRATESIPKTEAGRRVIPLDAQLVALLHAHETQQKIERLRAGEAWAGSGYVLVNELGEPYHPEYLSDRFEDLVAASGLRRIRLHDLRHTACSLMLAAGVPVKVVQEMAGHSSPAITLALYTHTTPSMGREAGAALSASLLG